MYSEVISGKILQTVSDNAPVTTQDGTQYPGSYPKADIPNLVKVTDPGAPNPSLDTLNSTDYAMVNGAPTVVYNTTPIPLDTVRTNQINNVLQPACDAAISAGTSSSALGSNYNYPTTPQDQANLSASVVDALVVKQDAVAWAAGVDVAVGAINVVNGEYLVATVAGKTGSTAPAVPAVGATVTDGGVTWEVWTTPFKCVNSSGVKALVPHTVAQIIQAGSDIKKFVLTQDQKLATLEGQVAAATTGADILAVAW